MAGGDLRVERGQGAAQRGQVAAGARRAVGRSAVDGVDHQPGVLRDGVRGEVPSLGRALPAHERALHSRDEREPRGAEHVQGRLGGGAGRLSEGERLPQTLRGDGQRQVRQQLPDGGLAAGADAAQALRIGPGGDEVEDLLAPCVVGSADVDAEAAVAGRAQGADHGSAHVGGDGGGELLGVGGGDGGGVHPGDAARDQGRDDHGLPHRVGAEQRGDDQLGVRDGLGGGGGDRGARLGEALRAGGGAVPDGELVVGEQMEGQLGAHAAGAQERDSHAASVPPGRPQRPVVRPRERAQWKS